MIIEWYLSGNVTFLIVETCGNITSFELPIPSIMGYFPKQTLFQTRGQSFSLLSSDTHTRPPPVVRNIHGQVRSYWYVQYIITFSSIYIYIQIRIYTYLNYAFFLCIKWIYMLLYYINVYQRTVHLLAVSKALRWLSKPKPGAQLPPETRAAGPSVEELDGSPIAGWMVRGKSIYKWMITRGTLW